MNSELLLNPRRNLIINGNFTFDQRNASISSAKWTRSASTNQYSLDCWHYQDDHGTFGTSTVWRELWSLGNSLTDSKYYLRQQITGVPASGTVRRWSHRIENVGTLANRKMGIAFLAWADTPFSITVEARQHFGTGGTPSSDVVFGTTVVVLPTSATRHELIFDVPSIVGKTLGTNNNHYLELRFNLPLNVAISGFNLGDVVVSEDFPLQYGLASADSLTGELILCQRYFEKSWNLETPVGTVTRIGANRVVGSTSIGQSFTLDTKFKVRKRDIPAFLYYAPDSGAVDNVTINGANVSNPGNDYVSEVNATDEIISTVNTICYWHWTARSEL